MQGQPGKPGSTATRAGGRWSTSPTKCSAGQVPPHLRDGHYSGAERLGNAIGYVYPHYQPGAVVPQQYAPDELVDTDYYHPTEYGAEREIAARVEKLRRIVRGR